MLTNPKTIKQKQVVARSLLIVTLSVVAVVLEVLVFTTIYTGGPVSYNDSTKKSLERLAVDRLQVRRYFTNYTANQEQYVEIKQDSEYDKKPKNFQSGHEQNADVKQDSHNEKKPKSVQS